MRSPITVLTLSILFSVALFSQEPSPEPPPGWKHSLVAGLTLSQVAFTDWVQGGENALSYTLTVDGKSVSDRERFDWTNIYKFAFGQTRLGDQGLRKTEDVIDLSSVYTYKLGGRVNPYGAASLKTQLAKGFIYGASGQATEVSKFFDPAYLTQSVGARYQVSEELKTRLGLALREVITNTFNQYTDDPETPEVEKTTVDGGLESVTNLDLPIDENVLLVSQLELFAPLKRLDEVIVRSTTTITGKVNKYITAIFNLQLINERRVTPRTQVKESISLGISYTLF